jgi:asparagine synthase (glutamine-hydrolysing)
MDAFLKHLRGMFSFIVFDKSNKTYFAARDHVGITPLYIGYGPDGSVWISSELKAIINDCARVEVFPPGHFYSSKTKQFELWYKPLWREPNPPRLPYNKMILRNALEASVKRRMMSDVPWGVLLSGGLDSSLVASIASRIIKRTRDDNDHYTWFPRLHSFCIGLKNSPDLVAAAKVAEFLGTVHHNYIYTIQEGLDAVREVIYHLETYDTTTVRASTPMFLMSRKIKAMGIKMVLSGEGADEVFGGYLYFHKAPNPDEMQAELIDKIANLHLFDCLRANKSTSAWGVEPRVPFLDADFLDVAMSIDPSEKMISKGKIEKHILRDAFDYPEDPYLPNEILWRQKEQFSDGVGYGWIDALRDNADKEVSDIMFANASNRFPENTPLSKEAYFYRSIFEEFFPQPSAIRTVPGGPSIACSTARAINWDESFKNRADCSGRSVKGVHSSAYDDSFKMTSDVATKRQKV